MGDGFLTGGNRGDPMAHFLEEGPGDDRVDLIVLNQEHRARPQLGTGRGQGDVALRDGRRIAFDHGQSEPDSTALS